MRCWPVRFEQSWRALFWNVPIQSGIFYICYYLSFNGSLLYPFPLPFPLNSAKLHTAESLCTTNPWYNELPSITNYTILHNKRCGSAPIINISPIEWLKLPQQVIYRRKGNLSDSPNHLKYWENILISRFYEQFSWSSRNLGHFGSLKKFQTLRTQTYHISFWSWWSGDSKYIICFAKYLNFAKISNNVFREILNCFRKTAKFEFW